MKKNIYIVVIIINFSKYLKSASSINNRVQKFNVKLINNIY